MTQGLQHILQLLLIHRHWQVGDIQVGGVLLLLLHRQNGHMEKKEKKIDLEKKRQQYESEEL